MNTIPYFYILEDTYTSELYAGVKYAAGCHPSTLMTDGGYTTSSELVKERIRESGLSRFKIRKITEMKDGVYAQLYEHRFLWKVKAPSNPRFLNQNYGNTPNQKGKKWWTNGRENRLSYECPVGFRKGKTQKSGPEHGHSGKPKNYKTVQKKTFEKNYTPHNKGVKQEIVICTHCNQTGGIRAMKRYHFDNCKMRKEM